MASAQDYADWIVKNADKRSTPEFDTVARAYMALRQPTEAAPDPSAGGGTLQFGPIDTGIRTPEWLDRGLAGAGKAFADVGRGVGQMVGAVDRQDVAESRRLDKALMNTTAGKIGNVAGNVAIFAPAALIPGAATVGGGALVGSAMGLMQPSTSTGETLFNTGIGGVAGAAVPLLQRAWASAKAAVEPFSASGQDAIVGRALRKAAGSDADAVTQRLREAGAPFVGPSQGTQRAVMGELVPGSMPTVGQAAENAGVASLERAAAATSPEATNAMDKAIKAQNAARADLLNNMAGSDGARMFAAANRDATAEQLYGAARRIGIDPAKLTPEALQNIAQFSQRIPDAILSKARELAKINGTSMTDATSVEGMHWIKMAVDDAIGSAKASGNGTLARAYTRLQDDLLTGLDRLSPAYAAARKTFADMSRPINQMDVAQQIADKSISKLTGNVKPNALAEAITDKTAQQATGFRGATLANTMENGQLNQLDMLLKDVQRAARAENAGKGTGSDTVRKLAYTNLLDQAGVPSFLRGPLPGIGNSLEATANVISRVADPLYGRANRELTERLAQVMMDPAQAAEVMAKATPAQRNQLIELLQRAASGAALSAPSASHALQQ